MHQPSQGIASAFTAWCDGTSSAEPLAGIPPAALTAIDCLLEQTPSASLHKIAAEAVRATPDTKDKGGKTALSAAFLLCSGARNGNRTRTAAMAKGF